MEMTNDNDMTRIVFEPIDIDQLKPLITFAFEDDPELLSTYSLLNNPTLEQSVDTNFNTIVEAFNSPVYCNGDDINIYRVMLDNDGYLQPIGFTVTVTNGDIPHDLFSFGINVNYRSKKTVLKWLEGVKELLGKYYAVTLHKNNTRAINLFLKNGFTSTNEGDKNVVTLFSNFKELIKKKSKILVSNGS